MSIIYEREEEDTPKYWSKQPMIPMTPMNQMNQTNSERTVKVYNPPVVKYVPNVSILTECDVDYKNEKNDKNENSNDWIENLYFETSNNLKQPNTSLTLEDVPDDNLKDIVNFLNSGSDYQSLKNVSKSIQSSISEDDKSSHLKKILSSKGYWVKIKNNPTTPKPNITNVIVNKTITLDPKMFPNLSKVIIDGGSRKFRNFHDGIKQISCSKILKFINKLEFLELRNFRFNERYVDIDDRFSEIEFPEYVKELHLVNVIGKIRTRDPFPKTVEILYFDECHFAFGFVDEDLSFKFPDSLNELCIIGYSRWLEIAQVPKSLKILKYMETELASISNKVPILQWIEDHVTEFLSLEVLEIDSTNDEAIYRIGNAITQMKNLKRVKFVSTIVSLGTILYAIGDSSVDTIIYDHVGGKNDTIYVPETIRIPKNLKFLILDKNVQEENIMVTDDFKKQVTILRE
jgi:hypothetical protein